MCRTLLIITIFLSIIARNSVQNERILIVTPTPSFSHQIVFRSLGLGLNKRGHDIIILTADPMKNSSLSNYTEIDFTYLYELSIEYKAIRVQRNMDLMMFKRYVCKLLNNLTEEVFKHPDMKKLYAMDSGVTFDAVIVEIILGPMIHVLGQRFNAPVIGISSLELRYNHEYIIGNPVLPSHISNWDNGVNTNDDISFWQKIKNFMYVWLCIYEWLNVHIARDYEMIKKYLGNDIPSIDDIRRNINLILTNKHAMLSPPKPELSNIVYFDSIHIEEIPPILPQNLKAFLDGATEGFIYVSFGGSIETTELSSEIVRDLSEIFSTLPCKVLWKVKDLYNLTSNIFTSEWLPQQGVLAHPNIKAFMYQGGLQSTEEAIHYSVPLIGAPLIFDQDFRVNYLVSLGVAKKLDIFLSSKEDINNAILEVLNDVRYKENMLKLRECVKDKPYDSLENAVWWIEFVMRHKGASHLQFSGMDEPWYQRYDRDVIAFLAVVAFVLCFLTFVVCIRMCLFIFRFYAKLI